ncbi:uncharacterized protein BJX67DRAFT_377337 [Aspergillus lucknowensis]|uniref:Uncharacterized protein n=1 Tax=Aspergillus lucknowensis TaxID=176173 RepID=A0ABR4M4R5_9EURO
MSTFFGRRHSIAAGWASPGENDTPSPRFIRRRASAPNLRERESRFHSVRGFFRWYRRSGKGNSSEQPSPSSSPPPTGRKLSRVRRGSTDVHQRHSDASSDGSSEYELTRSDIEVIFSGAPYFLLEKGKQDCWYPQVIFPFDDHDPTIQSLWDRRTLPYASYTLSTLHAHLPIPGDGLIEGDVPVQLDSWTRTASPKRATLDLGMFEVPNMLSMNGKEPGSVGFHYFLEMPVADALRFTDTPRARAEADFLRISSLPALKVEEMMELRSHPYSLCPDGTVHDRKAFLLEGPAAWKSIGVRDIDLQKLVVRLQKLKDIRHGVLHGQTERTILDSEGVQELFCGLFNDFLYQPPRSMTVGGEDFHSIQSQIRVLTVVLATPGAWFDFSMPEWRLRIGQILWEVAPHGDGDSLGPSVHEEPWDYPFLELEWFLVQMLLAAELLMRLDATVRVGLLGSSNDIRISRRDIQDFQRLRTPKVSWDMVAVRRLMDCFNFSYSPIQSQETQTAHPEQAKNLSAKSRRFPSQYFRGTLDPATAHVPASACRLVPEYIDRQLQGLLVFAESIGWPNITDLKEHFRPICKEGKSETVRDAYNRPIQGSPSAGGRRAFDSSLESRSLSYRPIMLRNPADNQNSTYLGGWVTRAWLSGLVLPGDCISHLLMSTILENDADAIATLGPVANLSGGFSYREKSWWSQECIVGRVLASLQGTSICMGWIESGVLPKDSRTRESLNNTWFEVISTDPPACPGGPRIMQGTKISLKSTPLGLGDLASGAFSLPVDSPITNGSKIKVDIESLIFDVQGKGRQQPQADRTTARKTTMVFSLRTSKRKSLKTVSFPLIYNVRFISSHECRPPGGRLLYSTPGTLYTGGSFSAPSSPARQRHLPRLPGHPLHRSYTYKVICVGSLPELAASESRLATLEYHRALSWHEIMVLDARGGPEQEAFARAWCATVGYHALIGRVGRTCLACCIREARAIKVRVVIRVGERSPSNALSKLNRRPSIFLHGETVDRGHRA